MRGYPQKVESMSGSFLHPLVWLVEFQLIMMKVLALFQLFMPISAFYFYFSTLFHSVFYRHFSVFPHFSVCPHFSVLSPFQRFIPISAFYPHFSVLSPFQRFIPISSFYPHFSVLSPFQRFIPISAFYPHFSVLFPFQRFIPISAFYPHFSVLSPFQRFIPISVSAYSFRFSDSGPCYAIPDYIGASRFLYRIGLLFTLRHCNPVLPRSKNHFALLVV